MIVASVRKRIGTNAVCRDIQETMREAIVERERITLVAHKHQFVGRIAGDDRATEFGTGERTKLVAQTDSCPTISPRPWAYRGATISLSNEFCPLTRAEFRSSVITGYSSNELMLMRDKSDTLAFNYRFSHCLLNIPADSIGADTLPDGRYYHVRIDSLGHDVNRITNFPLIDTDIFYYDFSLDSLSQAVGAGSADDARLLYPLDRLGRNRLEDEASDAGAREFVKPQEQTR